MKAVIYARGTDREQQAETCKEYANKNGLTIIGIESEWHGIEQYIYNMRTDAVIVSGPTIVAKGMIEHLTIEDNLKKFGVKVISAE